MLAGRTPAAGHPAPAEAPAGIGTMRGMTHDTGEPMRLDLTAPERDLLLNILEDELGSLKGEIYKTETRDYKEQLKGRESTLVALIERLQASAAG